MQHNLLILDLIHLNTSITCYINKYSKILYTYFKKLNIWHNTQIQYMLIYKCLRKGLCIKQADLDYTVGFDLHSGFFLFF